MRHKLLNVFAIAIISLVCSSLYALDLRFSGALSMTPETPSVGDTITFSVNFISADGATANLKVVGGVDGAQLYERTFANVPSGASRTISFTWSSTAGDHVVWFVLDPDGLLRETDLTNNQTSLRFNGGGPLTADLTITYTHIGHDRLNSDKIFYTIKFKNLGTACIGSFNWKMHGKVNGSGVDLCKTCPNGRFAAVRPLCALGAGEEKTHYGFFLKSDFRDTTKRECGKEGTRIKYDYYNNAEFIVDYNNKVDETDEHNNKSGNYTIRWGSECP